MALRNRMKFGFDLHFERTQLADPHPSSWRHGGGHLAVRQTAAMSGDQKARLRAVRGDDIVIAKSKYRVVSGSLELNPKFKAGFRALGIIGAGFTAYAWINYSNYDDQLLVIMDNLEDAKLTPNEEMK